MISDSLRFAIKAFAGLILLSSGLVDLPRSVPLGPVTLQPLLTVLYFFGGLLLLAVDGETTRVREAF
jgi:hypothetical protein